jgi:hypothetical protein
MDADGDGLLALPSATDAVPSDVGGSEQWSAGKKRRRQEDGKRNHVEPAPVSLRFDVAKFSRGPGVNTKVGGATRLPLLHTLISLQRVDDKKLKTKLKHHESQHRMAKNAAAEAELLLPETAGWVFVACCASFIPHAIKRRQVP